MVLIILQVHLPNLCLDSLMTYSLHLQRYNQEKISAVTRANRASVTSSTTEHTFRTPLLTIPVGVLNAAFIYLINLKCKRYHASLLPNNITNMANLSVENTRIPVKLNVKNVIR